MKENKEKDKKKIKPKKKEKIQTKDIKEDVEIKDNDSKEIIKEKIKKIKYLSFYVGNDGYSGEIEAFKENGEKLNEEEISSIQYKDFCFEVDVDTGKITNWTEWTDWTEEKIYFKAYIRAIDRGSYTYMDKNKNQIYEEQGYVPNFLGIEQEAYGDDIVFNTDVNGFILNWTEKRIKDKMIKYLEEQLIEI